LVFLNRSCRIWTSS